MPAFSTDEPTAQPAAHRGERWLAPFEPMSTSLTSPFTVGDVEIPSRIALAPMAGVSVQAFRRQGRRFGAGLVCSEMVSCSGLHHRNEKTLGYLHIASDESPLAVQIFGSDPALMADAACIVETAGADILDLNFGCPVPKITKAGAGATLVEEPGRACEIVSAAVEAVDIPVMVKMRLGLSEGSRSALDVGPRVVAAGASALTLHPRSTAQMYTGQADHSLTAELVQLVDVPVIASGGVGTLDHLVEGVTKGGASAVLAASIFHFGEYTIAEAKAHMAAAGIPMRLT